MTFDGLSHLNLEPHTSWMMLQRTRDLGCRQSMFTGSNDLQISSLHPRSSHFHHRTTSWKPIWTLKVLLLQSCPLKMHPLFIPSFMVHQTLRKDQGGLRSKTQFNMPVAEITEPSGYGCLASPLPCIFFSFFSSLAASLS